MPLRSRTHAGVWRAIALLRWPLIILAVVWMVQRVYWQTTNRLAEEARDWRERTLEVAQTNLNRTVSLPERFRQGTITRTFISSIPTVEGTGDGVLELATAKAVETFRWADRRTAAWGLLDLGTTVTEIRAPVTYRYHVRLSDDWLLNVADDTCLVFAPPIRPSQPPAIHTDGLEKRGRSGWARFNQRRQMEALERSLTPQLEQRAQDDEHLELVREQCRRTLKSFVSRWLLSEDQWGDGRFTAVQVVFPDEVAPLAQVSEPLALSR